MKPDPILVEPNACFWCDYPRRGHGRTWIHGGGFHAYTEPCDALRIIRMRKRRKAHLSMPRRQVSLP